VEWLWLAAIFYKLVLPAIEGQTDAIHGWKTIGRTTMDFIERLTGLSPDGGDGSMEMLFFTAIVVFALILLPPLAGKLYGRLRASE
jgi:hypothetical protein